jgi:hypothetical protein
MRLEGLGKLKNPTTLFRNGTHCLLTCGIVPQPHIRYRVELGAVYHSTFRLKLFIE